MGERWEVSVGAGESWDRREYVRCVECEKVGITLKQIEASMCWQCYLGIEGGLLAKNGEEVPMWMEDEIQRVREGEEREAEARNIGRELPFHEMVANGEAREMA